MALRFGNTKMFNFKATYLIILTEILLITISEGADSNVIIGMGYTLGIDCTSADVSFKDNHDILLNSLATNTSLHGGFYQTSVGKGSNKVYGFIQCRADLPAAQCSSCAEEATKTALNSTNSCPDKIWSTWCFLSYSNQSSLGEWDRALVGASLNTSRSNVSASALPESNSFLRELASNASKQPLMFQVGVLDLGQRGKRYGMAQCFKVIKRSECGDCLNQKINMLLGTSQNWTNRVSFSNGCGLWYYDYQFYFNISTSAASGSTRDSISGKRVSSMITALLVVLYLL